MRGWTARLAREVGDVGVVPAHAGMDRAPSRKSAPVTRCPRACGDGPDGDLDCQEMYELSPRMRGWTSSSRVAGMSSNVVPAHAGMDRYPIAMTNGANSCPRACGDGPNSDPLAPVCAMLSPRMRGWTGSWYEVNKNDVVVPAHAGMDRWTSAWRTPGRCCPRACGDGPRISGCGAQTPMLSPRMRGWTVTRTRPSLPARVVPAHAGMDRSRDASISRRYVVPAHAGMDRSRSAFTQF